MGERLLTIAEAAAGLHLSGSRVHQLLADGLLDGVELLPGRTRHVPNAPRVTAESVERLARHRADDHARRHPRRPDPTRAGTACGHDRSGIADVSATEPVDETAAARAAAQELKVELDVLRDQLRAERAHKQQLLDVVGTLAQMMKETSASTDRLDDVAAAYSGALTQLLSPTQLPEPSPESWPGADPDQ